MPSEHVTSVDPRAVLLRRLEQAIACDRPVGACEVALLVGRHAGDLVRDALRAPAPRDVPPDLRLQAHLRRVVAVMVVAARHGAGVMEAVYWYRTARPASLGGRTPEAATAEGCQADVCASLALSAANDEPSRGRRARD